MEGTWSIAKLSYTKWKIIKRLPKYATPSRKDAKFRPYRWRFGSVNPRRKIVWYHSIKRWTALKHSFIKQRPTYNIWCSNTGNRKWGWVFLHRWARWNLKDIFVQCSTGVVTGENYHGRNITKHMTTILLLTLYFKRRTLFNNRNYKY